VFFLYRSGLGEISVCFTGNCADTPLNQQVFCRRTFRKVNLRLVGSSLFLFSRRFIAWYN
jgi:hypothetical protein